MGSVPTGLRTVLCVCRYEVSISSTGYPKHLSLPCTVVNMCLGNCPSLRGSSSLPAGPCQIGSSPSSMQPDFSVSCLLLVMRYLVTLSPVSHLGRGMTSILFGPTNTRGLGQRFMHFRLGYMKPLAVVTTKTTDLARLGSCFALDYTLLRQVRLQTWTQ